MSSARLVLGARSPIFGREGSLSTVKVLVCETEYVLDGAHHAEEWLQAGHVVLFELPPAIWLDHLADKGDFAVLVESEE
eukprot:CAMPEP_0197937796 /NCGR_PEP_ID=MMETSP1439-20131203/117089_1 /TAXON_ID=66791 /ORGANISM="Gonyaulax spinifera, Strain CCMP409" /LENGTH=78 /DNA_ID=CAMNT_0043560835 /DNA_START=453 /DNA_END=685 /DNA_ORIENTATION=+